MGITAAMPAGWMRGSIGFAAAKGEGEKRGEREEKGGGGEVILPSSKYRSFLYSALTFFAS